MLSTTSVKSTPIIYNVSTLTTGAISGAVSTFMQNPIGADGAGNIYVSSTGNNGQSCLFYMISPSGVSTLIASIYIGTGASVGAPFSFGVTANGTIFYLGYFSINTVVYRFGPYTGTVIDTPTALFTAVISGRQAYALAVDKAGTAVYVVFGFVGIYKYTGWATTLTSNSLGTTNNSSASVVGMSTDQVGNIYGVGTDGISFINASGSLSLITATRPQSNTSGQGTLIAADTDNQAFVISGSALCKIANTPGSSIRTLITNPSLNTFSSNYGVCVNVNTRNVYILTSIPSSNQPISFAVYTPVY
jgi:hypothetical protein